MRQSVSPVLEVVTHFVVCMTPFHLYKMSVIDFDFLAEKHGQGAKNKIV